MKESSSLKDEAKHLDQEVHVFLPLGAGQFIFPAATSTLTALLSKWLLFEENRQKIRVCPTEH